MEKTFHALAERISNIVGSSWSFLTAIVLVVIWIVTGPLFDFSDTWQLIINTGTTIVTFLMVFLIQNTQNRDAIAVQLKLDELLRAVEGARTEMINLDMLSDTDLGRLKEEFQELARKTGSEEPLSTQTSITIETADCPAPKAAAAGGKA